MSEIIKVIANYGKLNLFWDKIADIADAGKRIYKSTAPNRVDDFTLAKLKARIDKSEIIPALKER